MSASDQREEESRQYVVSQSVGTSRYHSHTLCPRFSITASGQEVVQEYKIESGVCCIVPDVATSDDTAVEELGRLTSDLRTSTGSED